MVYYLIRTPTIKAIADAIEETNTSAAMPALNVHEEHDKHFILHETLVAIADEVRKATGSIKDIPVTELAERILAAFSGGSGTTAILGVAVLGKAILGNSTPARKLAAPTIYLDDKRVKLGTPVIRLEDVNKLARPTIYLAGDKLAAPTIYLDGDKLAAPEIYLVYPQLEAPVIRLEEVQ